MSEVTAEQAGTPATEAAAHFVTRHGELTAALRLAELAATSRGTILAETRGRAVLLRAQDYEAAVTVTCPAEPATAGRTCLDFAELKQTLAAAAAGEPKRAAAESPVTIDGAQLSTAQLSVPLSAYCVDTFPVPPPTAPPAATVEGPAFFRELARVLPAVGVDPAEPAHTMVRVELSGTLLRLASTDRYRIALADLPAQPWDTADAVPTRTALLPTRVLAKVVKQLSTYAGPVALGITADEAAPLVALTIGATEVTIHATSAAAFPSPDTHMPTERHHAVTIDRASMLRAARKAQALTGTRKAQAGTGGYQFVVIRWDHEGAVTLAPWYGPQEQARVRGGSVTSEVKDGAAADLSGRALLLTGRFLLNALDAFASQTVTLHLATAEATGLYLSPVLFTETDAITGQGYRHLIKPALVDWPPA
ncbi:hypothetical protein ACIP98_29230 [Streptomyces sp. NPDC088354]|uniref:hypothetical protein n=1 Tax=Streptomyces sp. NPDC088354 TaxID=3365856 RepID=UPI00381BF71A